MVGAELGKTEGASLGSRVGENDGKLVVGNKLGTVEGMSLNSVLFPSSRNR